MNLHPEAMLDPGWARSVCIGGGLPGPSISVTATVAGTSTSFDGEPGCDWPGGRAISAYYDATQHNLRGLAKVEPLLRCDDDPSLLALPTQWASVAGCLYGYWTATNEKLITVAERAATLGLPNPSRLFPHDVGAQACTIPAGGSLTRALHAQCGVYVSASPPEAVTFIVYWGSGVLAPMAKSKAGLHAPGRSLHHVDVSSFGSQDPAMRRTWSVSIRHGRAVAVSRSGAVLGHG